MQKILEDITSPEWWFSVVVAALIVGLVVVYVARIFDSTSRRFAGMLASRSKAARNLRKARVSHYVENPHLVPFLIAKYHGLQNYSLGAMVMAVLFLALTILVLTDNAGHAHQGARFVLMAVFLGWAALTWVFVVYVIRMASGYLLVMFEVERRLEIRTGPTDVQI